MLILLSESQWRHGCGPWLQARPYPPGSKEQVPVDPRENRGLLAFGAHCASICSQFAYQSGSGGNRRLQQRAVIQITATSHNRANISWARMNVFKLLAVNNLTFALGG
jgi:hypothetical protein